jgi:hypothetical protein
VIEVWRDISERSQLESQLAHSERLASLGLLAAGVAHEINNPLASVLAGVESLQRWLARREFDAAGTAEAGETLALLELEARRCRETTDKLMLLAQPVRTAPTHVDMNAAVRDTLSLLNYEMRKHGVRVVESLDPALPPVWARASGIRGVCMNLMLNAVQAMKRRTPPAHPVRGRRHRGRDRGHGPRSRARASRPHLGSVLHDQAGGAGHRSRSFDHAARGDAARRAHPRREPPGRGRAVHHMASARGAGRGRCLRPRCCWWMTRSRSARWWASRALATVRPQQPRVPAGDPQAFHLIVLDVHARGSGPDLLKESARWRLPRW